LTISEASGLNKPQLHNLAGNGVNWEKKYPLMKHHFLSLLIIVFSCSSYATTHYVTPLGSGALNGTSWGDAFAGNSLPLAISTAIAGDEVWVAAGVYKPTTGTSRTSSFIMKNGVAIYGSFAGGETLLSQRIFTNGLTSILSGEIGVAGIADNCYHTISNSGLDNTAIIDGFIIRDANDDRTATNTTGLGGGIYNNGSGAGNICNPTIRNCLITSNQAVFGAGIFNNGYNGGTAIPLISNCVITGNNAITSGGAMDNFGLQNGNASPIITNCVIYNNTAVLRAGGMYCWGGNNGNANPTVINTIFVNNTAPDGGAVVSDRSNSGAGSSGNSNPNFRNCIFWGNTASNSSPQFYILGGASFTATYSNIDLTGQISPHIISGAGTGNINSNPSFSNIASGAGTDGNWLTVDDGLKLAGTSSPCYNSGDNTGISGLDIIFNNRIIAGIVDMGAYEFNATSLAIKLTSFMGSFNRHNQVNLSWITASEQNNKGFDIQRSRDLIQFETIGFVKGAGNSNVKLNYFFTDHMPYPGQIYYRLKQIDLDTKDEYSNIISIKTISRKVDIFPNPSRGTFKISGLELSEIKSVKFINSVGIEVKVIRNISDGINISDLPDGVYTLFIETAKEVITTVLLKK